MNGIIDRFFLDKKPEKFIIEFLLILKKLYRDYLKKKVTALAVSNITILWWVHYDGYFGESLIQIDHRIKDLSAGMDITHPDFSRARREKIVMDLIERVDEILKDHKNDIN